MAWLMRFSIILHHLSSFEQSFVIALAVHTGDQCMGGAGHLRRSFCKRRGHRLATQGWQLSYVNESRSNHALSWLLEIPQSTAGQ